MPYVGWLHLIGNIIGHAAQMLEIKAANLVFNSCTLTLKRTHVKREEAKNRRIEGETKTSKPAAGRRRRTVRTASYLRFFDSS
jgi:hypothetical protein